MKIGDLVTIHGPKAGPLRGPYVDEDPLRGVIVGRFQVTPGTPRGYTVMTSTGIMQCYRYELLAC